MTEISPEEWLAHEDIACRKQRANRLSWLLNSTPPADIWKFSGGWLNQQLFEEARYSYVYGQFISSAVLGFAFVERTLASLFYASGRDDLTKATGQKLISEAVLIGWLTSEDAEAFDRARGLRNPLIHFREPLHEELPDMRAFRGGAERYEVVESDAKHILEVMFRMVAKQAITLNPSEEV